MRLYTGECVVDSSMGLWDRATHIRHKHHFECTICYDVSPTAEDLEEHIREKHGGLQPSEQELQTHRHREERLEQSEQRKEKAEAEARQTKYFPCKMCVEGFDTKRELDKHITDMHIFVCGECLKTFKTKEERDTHMKTDHKDVSTKMTNRRSYWLKSTAKESPEKKRTDEPQKPGRRCGHSTQPRRNSGQLKKEKEKENLQQHRPKKRQNLPRETTEMRMKTTSLLKNQVVRTHHMSQPKRS